VVAGHYLLAFVEMFQRDIERFKDCRKRTNVPPNGRQAPWQSRRNGRAGRKR